MTLIYQLIAVGIFMFMGIPCIQADVHTIVTSYTQIEGTRQEFYSVTEVDGKTVFYNNSKIKNLTSNQEWMKKIMSTEGWKQELQNRKKMQEIYDNNIRIMKGYINANEGTQIFQRTFGCTWDDKNDEVEAFDIYGHDGKNFSSLALQKKKYEPVAFSKQANRTITMWNRDSKQVDFLVNYYYKDCIFWLKEMWNLGKTDLEKIVSPKVSFLQKDSTSVVCHVTGFYPAVKITWIRNPSCKMYKSVEEGEILPNEDGTFQQSVALNIDPEDWDKCIYYCHVIYNGLNDAIWIDASKSNHTLKSNSVSTKGTVTGWSVTEILIIFLVIALVIGIVLVILVTWNRSRPASGSPGSSKSLITTEVV